MRIQCGVERSKISSRDNSIASTTTNPSPGSVRKLSRISCSEDLAMTKQHRQGVTASTKSSDDGISAAHSSIKEVSLENNSVSFQNHHVKKCHSISKTMNNKDQVDGSFQMRKKVVPKRLITESSSSNSSIATAVSSISEKKKKKKKINNNNSPNNLSVETEPSSSIDEKDNNNYNKPSWLNSVDSMPLKGGNEVPGNKKSFDGSGDSNLSRKQLQQFTVKKTEEDDQSQESCLRQMKRPKEVPMTSKSMTAVASPDSSQDVLGFDLNVDLEVNEGEANPWHPSFVDHSPRASEPVTVMAKIAVPNGLPSAPLQFDGQLAWRSSPTTSAFRPTTTTTLSSNHHSDKNLMNPCKQNNDSSTNTDHGFDLNIAAADSPPIEFESSAITTDFCPGGKSSSVEAKSPRNQNLSLDLNCGDDQKGSCHQTYHKLHMGGAFDLNENLSLTKTTETFTDVYHHHQSAAKNNNHQLQVTNHSLSANSTTTSSREGLGLGPGLVPGPGQLHMGMSSRPTAYWVDMSSSSIPNYAAQHLQGQSFVVDSAAANFFPVPSDSMPRQGSVAPLQSKVAFSPSGPHPGFYLAAASNGLPSYYPCSPNMFAPWTGQPGLTNFVPQFANGGQLRPPVYQAPPSIHVFESGSNSNVSQGSYSNIGGGSGQMSMMGPAAGCYPYNGTGMQVTSSVKEICNMGNANYERSFVGSVNQQMPPHIGERTTTQLPPQFNMGGGSGGASPPTAASVKRREPGGGWDSFQQQLNCRRMTTSWK